LGSPTFRLKRFQYVWRQGMAALGLSVNGQP
jgi:hypothetical protein